MNRFYVVVTGSDGAGKETQANKLVENLTNLNLKTKKISFPNYDSLSSGPVKLYLGGELCDDVSKINPYQSSLPYAIDRFCTMKQFNLSDNETQVVVFDRYAESNIMYQAIKIGDPQKREEFIAWLDDIEYGKLMIPRPNLTLFLNMPTEVSFRLAKERKNLKNEMSKDIHESNFEFLKKSYEFGLGVAKKLGWKIINCCDANGNLKTREEISEECLKVVKTHLEASHILADSEVQKGE